MSPSPDNPRPHKGDPLTARELQILALVAAGEPTAAIAQRLAISPNTVKGHLTHAYAKTGARNRVQAARHYLDHYMAPPVARSSQPRPDGRATRVQRSARSRAR